MKNFFIDYRASIYGSEGQDEDESSSPLILTDYPKKTTPQL